ATHLTVDPWLATVDENMLESAILNLAINARDAMPDGGRLSVRTRRVVDAALGGTRVPCALVDVRDNGTGMDAATRARIFEPFFTTKRVGKGTGLGLAMVYRFVTRLAGEVWVESALGAGTTFTLTLPLETDRDAEEAPDLPEPATTAGTSQVGAGTILIAEDQEDIRRVAEKVLTRMGYRVLTASDGAEAMMILGRERARVDLVLADLVMPRGGGGMLYRNTAGWLHRPAFLFMSGYAHGELNGDEALLKVVPFLAKPFTIDALQTAVRNALEAA
ncbi:MAG TPA: ATP-binding protein, partial [Longimicrobiales bacterium]|nr:ATP-binding protein [Longimicrobiales bacterium]